VEAVFRFVTRKRVDDARGILDLRGQIRHHGCKRRCTILREKLGARVLNEILRECFPGFLILLVRKRNLFGGNAGARRGGNEIVLIRFDQPTLKKPTPQITK
jgi:hypothetical protein